MEEPFVFLDVAKVPLCLDGTDLTLQDPLLTLDVRMRFFLQFFPPPIDLHDLVPVRILFCIVFIQAAGLMFTSTTVCTPIYFVSLSISILPFAFCPDMAQFPPIMADIGMLILKALFLSPYQ